MTTGGEEATRLVIEGPGAGVEVTASSVLADLAEAAARLQLRTPQKQSPIR